mgnify:FL=1|jgi:hypothetical protein
MDTKIESADSLANSPQILKDQMEKETEFQPSQFPAVSDMIIDGAKEVVDAVITTKPKPSEHFIPALARFNTAVPRLALKKSLDAFVVFVTVFLDKTFEKFGIVFEELEGPIYEKNIEKGKHTARKIATVYKDIFTDPELLSIIKEMLKTYLDFIKEFLRMVMLMVKERAYEAVDTGSQVAEKAWIKFGNAVLNAVQSLIPGVGNVMGLIRSIHGIVIGVQEASKKGMDFYLETQGKFIDVMRKVSPPGFTAAHASIDAFNTAKGLYAKATKSIDDLAGSVEGLGDGILDPRTADVDKIAEDIEKKQGNIDNVANSVEDKREAQRKDDEDFKRNYGKR